MSEWKMSGKREIEVEPGVTFGDWELENLCHVRNTEMARLTARAESAEQRLAEVLKMLKPGESPVMYGTHSDDYTPAWRRHRDLSDLHRRAVEIAEGTNADMG